ncbi:RrF2 family transcriptional regulator [Rubneribacter sp.]
MQITTDYAIRIVVYLATARGVRTAQDIAEHVGLSPVNVVRVVQKLLAAKVVASQRGHTGGYLLAASPDEITLLDVVEAMEGNAACRALNSTEAEYFPRTVFRDLYRRVDDMLASVTFGALVQEGWPR